MRGTQPGDATQHVAADPSDIVRIAAWLVVVSIIVAALYLGQNVLTPLAIAFLIGFALKPLVTWLTRRGLPRPVSVIVVILTLAMALTAFGFLVASQLATLSAQLPSYQTTIREKVRDVGASIRAPGMFDGVMRTVDSVQQEVETDQPEEVPPLRVQTVESEGRPLETALEWLTPALEPLATAGIVIVFLFLVLLDRGDMRDRLIRLLGGNLHQSTDALEDAAKRISKYLLMQVIVNVSYGVPMALGLWFIGVPGWLLWGALAAVLRFIPYLGPLLSSVFPLALAFAVGDGWQMVIWTLALILFLELISNNVVEPLLYGTSTGLSAMSLIAAATFWTALWGPIGLILSTPLTVCLLVLGRGNPQLGFLDTLLGSTPVLDVPTRIYQRLIADKPEDAIEIVDDTIEDDDVVEFYNDHGIEVLRKVSEDYLSNARPEHRQRVFNGMDALLDDLKEEYPPAIAPGDAPRIACIGGRWEIDSLACEMLVHALGLAGLPAVQRREGVVSTRYVNNLDLDGIDIICLSYFSREPALSIKAFCRRLRNRWPDKRIVVALWNAPPAILEPGAIASLGADEIVTTVQEAVLRIQRMIAPEKALARPVSDLPENEAARVQALMETHILDGHAREDLNALAKRAAAVFDVKFAVISVMSAAEEYVIGQSIDLAGTKTDDGTDMIILQRDQALCDHAVAEGDLLVVSDTRRDPRFADHPALRLWGTSFYAAAPLKTADGVVLGALSLFDAKPRKLSEEELTLLESMAADVVSAITGEEAVEPEPREPEKPSTAVAQPVPD
ncbi:AI-2E family transporter [Aurantimonas sp. HBX-1]|uniref:AI-2E family transporter n=1 Tax=Aurantimonas sp. HBX-1 TaxID=2906072 RepID=UPI001F427F3D|nr:AI-2E family transporter [Aurantimonas sp. HBX-1]UIJ71595.1 AI-2E family transporter [Aurantimonas sp. HBX-1]